MPPSSAKLPEVRVAPQDSQGILDLPGDDVGIAVKEVVVFMEEGFQTFVADEVGLRLQIGVTGVEAECRGVIREEC